MDKAWPQIPFSERAHCLEDLKGRTHARRCCLAAWLRSLALLLCALEWARVDSVRAGDFSPFWRAGPLAQKFPLTFAEGTRTEVLGPLWNFQETGNETLWGVPPAISYKIDRSTDSEEMDVLYPLISYDRFGKEYRFHLMQWLAFSGGESIGGGTRDRFHLFPLYFQQRSADDPSRNYTAFLPFYGSMRQKMFRDRVEFILFPLYVETQKRDVITKNYMLPFFHLREGEQLSGWQFWPLGGQERKDSFSRTNTLDQVEVSPGHVKSFVLWPIFSSDRTGVGTDNEGTFLALLPLGAWQRSPNRDASTYLWPFFSYVDDREKKYREWGLPWPFIVASLGEGKTGWRVWPLYGSVRTDSKSTRTVLWPLWRGERAKAPAIERDRHRAMLFLYSSIHEKNVRANQTRRRTDFWPLFTWKREYDGSTKLQALSLVEPFVLNNKSVERNYSPLWSLWRSEHHAKTGKSSLSVLWNLYRQETGRETLRRSFLFGLYQCEDVGGQRKHRVFFIPFGKRSAAPLDNPAAIP